MIELQLPTPEELERDPAFRELTGAEQLAVWHSSVAYHRVKRQRELSQTIQKTVTRFMGGKLTDETVHLMTEAVREDMIDAFGPEFGGVESFSVVEDDPGLLRRSLQQSFTIRWKYQGQEFGIKVST